MKWKAKDRGNTYLMKVKVEDDEIFKRVHVDKLPMYLVHTVEWMLPGPEQKRLF